jgi:YD repeat-containing protein
MLWGQPIKVLTDHKNLMRDALGLTSDWDYRWRLLLEEYGPKIVYIKGIHNTIADAISRLEYDPSDNRTAEVILRRKSTETQEAFKGKPGWQSQNIGVN